MCVGAGSDMIPGVGVHRVKLPYLTSTGRGHKRKKAKYPPFLYTEYSGSRESLSVFLSCI